MNEIKTLNGYPLADETARTAAEANAATIGQLIEATAAAIGQLNEEIAEIKENGTGSGSGLPEVDGSNRLLMTNEYENVIWVDGGIEPRLITSNMLTLNNPSTNRYIYDFAAVGIIEGETYTFVITPTTSDNNTYEVIQSEISAVAEITNDRFGNVAYIFNFDNINLYKNKKTGNCFGALKSITFYTAYTYCFIEGVPIDGTAGQINILTNVPTLRTGFSNLAVWSSTPDSAKRFKIAVDDAGTLTATEIT